MLIINIDLQERLVNGQLVIITHTSIDMKGNVTGIHIKISDWKAKLKIINTDTFAMYGS